MMIVGRPGEELLTIHAGHKSSKLAPTMRMGPCGSHSFSNWMKLQFIFDACREKTMARTQSFDVFLVHFPTNNLFILTNPRLNVRAHLPLKQLGANKHGFVCKLLH